MARRSPQTNTPQIQYVNSPEKDFSAGIDARSPENQIGPGFVRDLLNADIIETGVRTRQGYMGYAGNLPVRVTAMEYDATTHQICLSLDSSVSLDTAVSLEALRSSPLVLFGRSSLFTTGQGPFTTDGDVSKYYSSFTIPTRKKFTAPSGTLVIDGSEHGFQNTNLFVGVGESTSSTDRSLLSIYPDTTTISESTFDVSLGYTTYVDQDVFVYFANKFPVSGSSYVATLIHTGSPVSQTFTIPAGTHGLSNFNITSQLQQDLGTSRQFIQPDIQTLATNGDVQVTISNGTGSSQTYYLILSAAPLSNRISGTVAGGVTGTIVISAAEKPWVFQNIYIEQTPGGTKELVLAENISYDDSTQQITLSFTNPRTMATSYTAFYEFGEIRSNQLCVSDSSVTVDGTDLLPQITIWGLDHDDIYSLKVQREGWVSHIDSYRRSGEQRIISGLGGNLFGAREYNEAAASYSYPILYANLNTRTSSNISIAPTLWDTGELPGRTRGYITADNSGSHWATVSSVAYNSITGNVDYTLSLPSKLILDSSANPTTLDSVISTTANLEDYLTIQGMSYKRHEGTYKIVSVTDGIDQIVISVENSNIDSSDYDDQHTAGEAGIFTDQIPWFANAPYISGDELISEVLSDTITCTAVSSLGMLTVVTTPTDLLQIPAGVLFGGSRKSSVLPLRQPAPSKASSVDSLVQGDMLSYPGIYRLLRVLYINSDIDRTVDITSDGTTATVTLMSGDTSFLAPGHQVLVTQAGPYTGTLMVSDVLSGTSFTFDTTETTSVTGALLNGSTAEIDESLSWEDDIGQSFPFRVERRWIPLEAPDDSFDLTPSTHVRYLDSNSYTDQPFLRSSMVVNNMYLTNYSDENYKIDGTSMYRSGIIPWQSGLFLSQDTTSTAKIVTDTRTITYSLSVPNTAQGSIEIASADMQSIPIGSTVLISGSDQSYTVRDYNEDTAAVKYYILFDRALDSAITATGTIDEIAIFRYYFRLNAVDANSNIIASAATGFQDHVVQLAGNASVQLKMVGLPVWDVYDYSRLELQIYRTKQGQVAPFYLITTLPISFDNTDGYLTFRDAFADSDLTQLDVVNTALKGTELGTNFSDPPRARYITTVGNQQVLGNIRDYPLLDMQIIGDSTLDNATFNGTKFLFRRDGQQDLGTATNMVSRVTYELVNGLTGTISTPTIGSDQISFDTSSPTSAVAGDWIYLTYAAVSTSGTDLTYSGWYQMAVVSGTTVTINILGAAAATAYPDSYVIATDPSDVPVLLGEDGSLGMVNGDSFDTFDTMRRMSMAINATMRMVDTSITGMSAFTPWIISRGGNDTAQAGRILVRQPRSDSLALSVTPTFSGYKLFINSILSTTDTLSFASSKIFASRILISYQNFPEIIDSPFTTLDTDSDSAIDINSADGQDITGVIPFFGEAAFTAAQQAAILIVFKANSIYLVDINQKRAGQPAVQRIESEGLGCTAPYSIASTKYGIIFANESGMYCLRRDQSIQYLGRFMERNWLENVDRNALEIMQGHHWGTGRMYKLSVPYLSDIDPSTQYIQNNNVYVYNHTGEEITNENTSGYQVGGRSCWARYDNQPATGWANLQSDAFFGSATGRVFQVRQGGDVDDYRDDNQPIHFLVDLRPNDFGNSGIRKIVDKVIIHYRSGSNATETDVSYSSDMESEYSATTPIDLPALSTNSLSDTISKDITSVRHSVDRRRGVYFNIRIENTALDQPLEIAGVDYKVGGLSDRGILSAGSIAK